MSIIGVLNLKEIEIWEGLCKKKNLKKIGQFLGTNISRSAEVISFNFDM